MSKCATCGEELGRYAYSAYGKDYCTQQCVIKGLIEDKHVAFGAPRKSVCAFCNKSLSKMHVSGLVWKDKAFCDEGDMVMYLIKAGVVQEKEVSV